MSANGEIKTTPKRDCSVAEVVRDLARLKLETAREGLSRAAGKSAAEGLHDFRVALRRLRSLLKAFPEAFADHDRERALLHLRRIGAASGPARDAQAQLEWLHERLGARGRALRELRRELTRLLEGRRAFGEGLLREQGVPEFFALWSELHAAAEGRRAGEALDPRADEPFTRAAGRAIALAVQRLERDLGRVHSLADEAIAHEARIDAKALRYVLEPLEDSERAVPGVLSELRELQDCLGELNDLRALRVTVRGEFERAALARAHARVAAVEQGDAQAERRARRSLLEDGCAEALRCIERRRQERFAQLDGAWLGGRGQAFFSRVHGLLADLLELPPGKPEVERKFLLSAMPALPQAAEVLEIAQGYLGDGAGSERLRRAAGPGGVHYYRTVKLGRGVSRLEFEQEISEQEFERLWPVTEGCRVHKRRHRVPESGGTWEIDEFTDRALVLAELELGDANAEIALPPWLSSAVLREVTDDPRYSNLSLARTSRPASSG